MEFLAIIISIICLILLGGLRSRISHIEEFLKSQEPHQEKKATPEAFFEKPPEIQPQPVQEPSSFASQKMQPNWFDNFIDWLKEDWLLKLGAFLLLIGFGWLTTYAFLNNWIGPMGRIALGIVAGALILMLGWWRIRKYLHQGSIFITLGSTVILLTILAAREIYQFFTPVSALFIMFLSIVFVALASIKYHTKALALASLILASIAPLLINASPFNYILLFSYLIIVVLGIIWVVALTNWRELTTAALIAITFYSLPHLVSSISPDNSNILLLFAYAFASIFFIANVFDFLHARKKDLWPNILTAMGNGLLLLAWIVSTGQDEWRSLIITFWMIVFTVAAFAVFKLTKDYKPFYAYSGVVIAMLATATALELSGAALMIAYTIEASLIVLITYTIINNLDIVMRAGTLLIIPALMSFGSMTSRNWNPLWKEYPGLFHKDFFSLLIIALSLLGLAGFFFAQKKSKNKNFILFITTLAITGSIYIYTLLWLSLRSTIQNTDTAVTICLIIYTIIGLIFYLKGQFKSSKTLRLYGAILLGFVVGRLLIIDVWKMALSGRITIFFLVGILLMSTAFLGRKSQEQIKDKNY
jgi:uncharacterized membrane protein